MTLWQILADVARAGAHHVEVGPRGLVGGFRPGHYEGELAGLDDFRIAADRRGEVFDPLLCQDLPQLGGAFERYR
jgi:hypothetical protein